MKKRISLLLAVVMVLGSFASVFATNTVLTQEETDAARFLNEHGILIGNSGGLLLDKELIRQDSVILLSRLLGVEEEAESHKITNSIKKFKDLPNDNYYKRNISWAVENKYYEGTSANKFSPKRALRVEEYATVLMRALNHSEEDWRKNYDKAVELGILENVNVEGPEQDILRKDVAVMTYNALGTKLKGSDVTLAQSLGIEMPVEPEKPEVKEWELRIEAPKTIKSDGQATEVVKFGLYRFGKLDKTANDVVLDVNTTYGSFSQKRVTIQNGEAELILRSEFQENEVVARIDAQIIEAEGEHKELIGKVVAEPAFVIFTHEGGDNGQTIKIKQLAQVNSNEADRVTMIFDEVLEEKDFYQINEKTGKVMYQNAENGNLPVLLNNVQVVQDGNSKTIRTIILSKTNPKAATIILEKDSYLTDNKDVSVRAKVGEYGSANPKTFKLTDARRPNMTGVKEINNREIEVSFSEPIHEAKFIIDGRFEEGKHFVSKFGDVTFDKDGNAIDRRNKAVITLNDNYQEPDKKNGKFVYPAGYFKPGVHSIQASEIKDFAAITDENNVGTTQSLSFKIEEDKTETKAEVTVESPEQFRITFNNAVAFKNNKTTAEALKEILTFKVRQYDNDKKENVWVEVKDAFKNFEEKDLVVTEVEKGREYKVELAKDWTHIYNTQETNSNYYNNRFRLELEKEAVKTVSNGRVNKEAMILDLSESGSVLTRPDTVSPSIVDITKAKDFSIKNGKFVVEMSKPVKLKDHKDASGSETTAQDQKQLPTTTVEFIGKDKDGIIRTLPGVVLGYADDAKLTDKFVSVAWIEKDGSTPQTVVDAGGSIDWTVVVRAISDDVGNVAATAAKEFTLEPSQKPVQPIGDFRVVNKGGQAVGQDGVTKRFKVSGVNDVVTIEFTKDVSVVGINAATDVKNYTLNGKDLPTKTNIKLAKVDGEVQGNIVEIHLPKGTLQTSNVIVLAEQIESINGDSLKGDRAFTFIEGEVGPGEDDKDKDKEVTVKAVEQVKDVTVKQGEEVKLPETVKVTLSNDKTEDVKVEWNTKDVDFNEAKTHEIAGTIVLAKDAEYTISDALKKVTVKVVVSEKDKEEKELEDVLNLEGTKITSMIPGTGVLRLDFKEDVKDFAVEVNGKKINNATMKKYEDQGNVYAVNIYDVKIGDTAELKITVDEVDYTLEVKVGAMD